MLAGDNLEAPESGLTALTRHWPVNACLQVNGHDRTGAKVGLAPVFFEVWAVIPQSALWAGLISLSLSAVLPTLAQDDVPEPENAATEKDDETSDAGSEPPAGDTGDASAEDVSEVAEPPAQPLTQAETDGTPPPGPSGKDDEDASTEAGFAPKPERPEPKPLPQVRALVGGTIVPGNGTEPIVDGILLLGAKRITAVGSRDDVAIPEQAEVIDVTGRWIVPGLIDAHVHFFQSGSLYTRPDVIDLRDITPYKDDLARSKEDLPATFQRYLAAGVTSVLDAGGPNWNFDVRALADGAKAPRVAIAGPLIATEPIERQQRLIVGEDAPIVAAASPADAAELARKLIEKKPDAVKIWAIGGGAEGTDRARAITAAVKAVAEPAGIPVMVHATNLAMAKDVVLGGADVLVHSVDNRAIDGEFVRLLKNGNVTYVTTLTVLEGYRDVFQGPPSLSTEERRLADPLILRSLSEMPTDLLKPAGTEMTARLKTAMTNAKTLMAEGVRVATGTDAGNIGTLHGGSMHRELELLAEAGIAPIDIITIATQNAAYALTANPDFGVLKAGFAADFVILRRDPLADITALADIETVWIGGRSLTRRELVPRTAEAVVQEQLDAYNRRDLDAFAQSFADDIRIYSLSRPTAPQVAGKNQMREVYGSLFSLPDEKKIVCEVVTRIAEGDFVTDQQNCRTLDGRSLRARTTVTYEVKDGLISKMWFAE